MLPTLFLKTTCRHVIAPALPQIGGFLPSPVVACHLSPPKSYPLPSVSPACHVFFASQVLPYTYLLLSHLITTNCLLLCTHVILVLCNYNSCIAKCHCNLIINASKVLDAPLCYVQLFLLNFFFLL